MESRFLRAEAGLPHFGCDEIEGAGRYSFGQFRDPPPDLLQHLLQHQDALPIQHCQ